MKKTAIVIIIILIVLGIVGWKMGWFNKKTTSSIPACNSLGLDQAQIDILKAQGKCV